MGENHLQVATPAATPGLTAALKEKETVTWIHTVLANSSVVKTTAMDLVLTAQMTVASSQSTKVYILVNILRSYAQKQVTSTLWECLKQE